MDSLVVALAGGAIGATVTASLRLLGVPGDIREHDHLVHEADRDLELWLIDRKPTVDHELEAILEDLASRGLLHSGARNWQRAKAKERALRAWLDQEREADRLVRRLRAREHFGHRVWRSIARQPHPYLATPRAAQPVLDLWREPESFESSPELLIDDPTRATLGELLDEVGRPVMPSGT